MEGYYGDEAVGRGPTNRRKVVLIGVVDHARSNKRFKTPLKTPLV